MLFIECVIKSRTIMSAKSVDVLWWMYKSNTKLLSSLQNKDNCKHNKMWVKVWNIQSDGIGSDSNSVEALSQSKLPIEPYDTSRWIHCLTPPLQKKTKERRSESKTIAFAERKKINKTHSQFAWLIKGNKLVEQITDLTKASMYSHIRAIISIHAWCFSSSSIVRWVCTKKQFVNGIVKFHSFKEQPAYFSLQTKTHVKCKMSLKCIAIRLLKIVYLSMSKSKFIAF